MRDLSQLGKRHNRSATTPSRGLLPPSGPSREEPILSLPAASVQLFEAPPSIRVDSLNVGEASSEPEGVDDGPPHDGET
jgi:hypothetical protein